jgi:DNA-directed RNA polymerase specialized sigma24 family protein
VRRDIEGNVFAEREGEHSSVGLGKRLFEEIRPLVNLHGVGTETLVAALEAALLEVGTGENDVSREELRSTLLGLVLWKIFGRGSALWIASKTEAGHEVPLDLLVLAFAMWEGAVNLATKYGVDTAAAAEALAAATHATADKLAGSGVAREGNKIRDVRNYLFASYMYTIFNIAGKHGSSQPDYVDMEDWVANREDSDKGAFLEVVESGVYCRELLEAMPPKARSVAIARYVLGYSWSETAGALGSSINAAQKALSIGVRRAIGTCMQELRRARHRKPVDIETRKKRGKKAAI